MSVNQQDYVWPSNINPVVRPCPPPPFSKVIPRLTPINCQPTCEIHWPDRQAYQSLAEKAEKLERQLDLLKQKMKTLEEPERNQPPQSVYSDDYAVKGISHVKYKVVLDSVNNLDAIKATRRNLKDRNNLLVYPHPLPATGRPHPVFLTVGKPPKLPKPLTEYQDGISKNGLAMVMASQKT